MCFAYNIDVYQNTDNYHTMKKIQNIKFAKLF